MPYGFSLKTLLYLFLLLYAFASSAHAKQDLITFDIAQKQFTALKIDTNIVIDGKLDEVIWKNAETISDFHQIDPVEYAAPSEKTEVRILYNNDFLYISARMLDSEASKIIGRQKIQGQSIYSDDRFEIHLDTFHDQRNGYFFQSNANGIRRDALMTNTRFIDDWDGIWYVATHIDSTGWTAEFAIPFKTLSFNPEQQQWGINFSRTIPRKNEEVAWSSRNRRLQPANAGDMLGLHGMQQGLGLDIIPSARTQWQKDWELNQTDHTAEPSLDIFYKINEAINAALTVNTDFSATEVDDRQINLSRFSLFVPEKRDFFLQDAQIFEFGGIHYNGRPFFSRTIGLDDEGTPINLNYGLKITGQSEHMNFAVLSIEQDQTDRFEKTQLNVSRMNLNILDESSVGLILTDGNPRNNSTNQVAGLDFNYLNSHFLDNQTLEASLWIQQSDDANIKDSAFGTNFRLPNDKHELELNWLKVGEAFNPAMGFVNRNNIQKKEFRYRFRTRPEDSYWRIHNYEINYETTDDLQGNLQSRELLLRPIDLFNHSGDYLLIDFVRKTEILEEDFNIFGDVIIPIGRYDFNEVQLRLETADQRPIGFELGLQNGDFYNGRRKGFSTQIEWQRQNSLQLSLFLSYDDITLETGNFIARIFQLRSTYAFNAAWSWINLLQYDNDSNAFSLNSRLRYFPKPGKEWFLIANHGYNIDDDNHFSSSFSNFVIKINHLLRF